MLENRYEIIVAGGGHAGIEAALASSRMGIKTLLVTLDISGIARMSCNPAIGGLAKGHLVKEIDALGGIMSIASDKNTLQMKTLNKSKGRAVWSSRAQIDKITYPKFIQQKLEGDDNITIIEDEVINIDTNNATMSSVNTKGGLKISCMCLIVTAGTFMNGVIHIGESQTPAGRYNEKPTTGLSEQLKKLNFKIGRLKTGTPPRLDSRTINYQNLEEQLADENPYFFSFLTSKNLNKQISCRMTYTNEAVHKIISKNLKKSSMYSGNIKSIGPRYCPSIEDKIVKFTDKHRHQIFLEPEGLEDYTVYPNGISTSLPQDIQQEICSKINGLENVKILRAGYAIEYDFVDPRELFLTLESKKIKNLYMAGQINGTTGYEEAAAQGLIAGINAALSVEGSEPFILNRSEAYIGVMIDDLVTKGVAEPYRMFTSRAEYRLSLRADNADLRLTEKGMKIGLIGQERAILFKEKLKNLKIIQNKMEMLKISPSRASEFKINIAKDGVLRTANQILSQKDVNMSKIREIWPQIPKFSYEIDDQVEINAHYKGYLTKQNADILAFKRDENLIIPDNINYSDLSGLSNEVKAKFIKIRPKTLGQALRIDGITPAAVYILLSHVKRKSIKHIA